MRGRPCLAAPPQTRSSLVALALGRSFCALRSAARGPFSSPTARPSPPHFPASASPPAPSAVNWSPVQRSRTPSAMCKLQVSAASAAAKGEGEMRAVRLRQRGAPSSPGRWAVHGPGTSAAMQSAPSAPGDVVQAWGEPSRTRPGPPPPRFGAARLSDPAGRPLRTCVRPALTTLSPPPPPTPPPQVALCLLAMVMCAQATEYGHRRLQVSLPPATRRLRSPRRRRQESDWSSDPATLRNLLGVAVLTAAAAPPPADVRLPAPPVDLRQPPPPGHLRLPPPPGHL